MAIIKRNLNSILGAFTKVQAELDAFIDEQAKRKNIALGNLAKIETLATNQRAIMDDADTQAVKAYNVRNKIAALIE